MFRSKEESAEIIGLTKKNRRDLSASLAVFAALAVAVIVRYVMNLTGQLGDGTVSTRLRMYDDDAQWITAPNGASVQAGPGIPLQMPTESLSPVTTGFLRAGDLLESVGYLVVLGLLAVLVVRFIRGGIFELWSARLVNAVAIASILAVFLPVIPRQLGGNIAAHDLGWIGADVPDAHVDTEVLNADFWPIYVFCMAFSAMAVIMKIGSRMARDQAGLV
ncbi:hypothetical protein [Rhodococcus sp. NPDC058521]|uniref:hypothetical protein n=1 Tax=Rhodococcus sp. NPDC058521 TaxID=3346536 RepID=UPI0036653059